MKTSVKSCKDCYKHRCTKRCNQVRELDSALRNIDEAIHKLRRARVKVARVRDELLRG
ncbi:MAG: hypothetical protein OWU32_04485 [Firmicutes bacterium]|nr:hypothetical protein [Bacillota bacterium]